MSITVEDLDSALLAIDQVDEADSFNEDAVGDKERPETGHVAKWFLDRYAFIAPDTPNKKDLLIYRDGRGIWKDADAFVRHTIRQLADFNVTRYLVEEVLAGLRETSLTRKPGGDYTKWEDFDRTLGIVVQNGVLTPDNPALGSFDSARLDTVQLPVEYDSVAECPLWEKTVREWVREEHIPLLQEAFGYSLVRDYRFHRWFLLVGNGSNGKGTCMAILTALVGLENVSAVSLQSLDESNNQYAKAALHGKLVNICGDIPDKPLRNTGDLKQLTGGDVVMFERKFRDPIFRENTAKLWFLGNKVPMTDDESDAFYRRVTTLPFETFFDEESANPDLREELKKELPGILNWALEGLQRLYTNGGFSATTSVEERRDDYRRLSDNVYGFSKDAVEEKEGAFVPVSDLWTAYVRYCFRMKTKPLARKTFEERLQKWIPAAYKHRRWTGEKTRPHAWENLTLLDQIDQKDQGKRTYREEVRFFERE